MKHNKKSLILFIAAWVILLGTFFYCFFGHKLISVVKDCEIVFGCTPSEFVLGKSDIPDEIKFLEKSAGVNQNGKLELRLTYYEWERFKRSDWLNPHNVLKDTPDIVLAEDYSKITIYADKDQYISMEEVNELTTKLKEVVAKVQIIHIINKTPFEKRQMYFVIVDRETNEVAHMSKLIDIN